MAEEAKERWEELCEQAVAEQDSEKLMKLVREIVQILDERFKQKAEVKKRTEASGAK